MTMISRLVSAIIVLVVCASLLSVATTKVYHEYCVVGAGPGGTF